MPHVANLHEALEGINDRKLITALRLAQVLDQKKNYVSTHSVKNGAITAEKIAENSVLTEKLADNSVVTSKILDNAVTSPKISASSILTDKLANNAVTSAKILNANITNEKLADNVVTSTKISANAVTNEKLADQVINTKKLSTTDLILPENTLATTKNLNDCSEALATTAFVQRGLNVLQGDGFPAFLALDKSNGVLITSVRSFESCYIGNGQIVYRNNTDGKLYLKNLFDFNPKPSLLKEENISEDLVLENKADFSWWHKLKNWF